MIIEYCAARIKNVKDVSFCNSIDRCFSVVCGPSRALCGSPRHRRPFQKRRKQLFYARTLLNTPSCVQSVFVHFEFSPQVHNTCLAYHACIIINTVARFTTSASNNTFTSASYIPFITLAFSTCRLEGPCRKFGF